MSRFLLNLKDENICLQKDLCKSVHNSHKQEIIHKSTNIRTVKMDKQIAEHWNIV